MAAKVNKSVVIGLIVCVVLAVAGVVVVMTMVLKSGADLAAQGDTLMAQEKYEEAATAFSKAVNKEQNNVEYYRKWAEALSKQNPTSIQAYTDRYRQWVGAQSGIANVLRTDPAAHRVILDLELQGARLTPRAGPAWQSLESKAGDVIARMKNEPAEKVDQIRRYRGISTVGKMSQAMDVSPEDRKRAKEDLLAAMALPGGDGIAAGYYADLMRLNAAKLRQTSNADEAAKTMAEAHAVMSDYCAKHPTSTAAKLGLVQLDLADLSARNPSQDLQPQAKPMIEDLMATMESQDAKTLDAFVATQVLQFAVGAKVDNAVARGVAVYDKLCAAHPDEPYTMLMRARFRATTDTPRDAVNEYKKIMELPNQPVSASGIALFGVRDAASVQRVEALINMVDKAKTPQERAAALAEAKAARDEVKARSTVDNTPKLLLDAKLAWLSGEGADARKLLDQYHKACTPPFSDTQALYMSYQVLRSQGLKGEAKSMLSRIVEMRVANAEVYRRLAELDYEMSNFPSALSWVEQALNQAPGDENLLKLKDIIIGVINPNNPNTTPMQRALSEAQAALKLAPPDKQKARQKGTEALGLCTTVDDFVQVTYTLGSVDRVDGLSAVKRALERFPDDKRLLSMKERLEIEDPIDYAVKKIDADPNLKPIEKALQKYLVYSGAGKMTDANKFLDEAVAIDADHPLSVAGMFERAIADRGAEGKIKPDSLVKAKELALKAKDKNLDKVDGRIYQARLAEAQGLYNEAIPLLERATEIDALNPLTWRYLSNAYLNVGNMSKALSSIERSLQIKPDDVGSIVQRVRILAGMDRAQEALAAAREGTRLGISDPVFIHMWLLLEFRVGDKDLAVERRAWIFNTQPENADNALEYAKTLMQTGKLELAKDVLDKVDAQAAKDPARKGLQQPLRMLRAALRGAKGDADGALAELDKLASELPPDAPERREALYVEFADLVKVVGATDLSMKVLEAGRKYQGEGRIDRQLGDAYFQKGDWEKARAAYGRAGELSKEDADNLLKKRIIECLMKDKQYDEAQKLVDALGGDKANDLQVLLLGAQLQFAKGDRSRGMKLLDEAVRVAPDKALPYRQRGIERMSDPRTVDDAIVDLEQAVGIEPRNTDLVVMLSRAYIRKGVPAKALTVVENALKIQPESPLLRNEHIQQLISQQQHAEAIKSCDEAAKIDEKNPRWQMLKGVVYQMMNDQETASRCYEDAWRIRRSADTGKALADALMATYDAQPAKNPGLLDRAGQVLGDPGAGLAQEPMVRMSRVTLALRQGRRPDAVADLRAVLANPAFKLSEPQRGNFFLDELRRPFAGDMKEVMKLLVEVTPKEGWPDAFMVNVARAQLSDKDLRAKALNDLELLIKSNDKAAAIGAAGTLGANAYLDKDVDRSVRALQAGLAIDGENVELNNNLAYVLCVAKKEASNALPFALKASDKDPNNPNILDTLGVIYLELAPPQLDKAEETLNRARAIAPDGLSRTMPTVHLIQAKLKKGAKAEAESLLQELKALQETEPRVKKTYGRDIEELIKSMQPTP